MASKRQPDWDIDLSEGKGGEQLVADLFGGATTIEVKTDRRAIDTGNLFLEYACKGPTGYYPSGIMESKAAYYCFVIKSPTGNLVLSVPTGVLKKYVEQSIEERKNLKELRTGSHPTKGVILAISELMGLVR